MQKEIMIGRLFIFLCILVDLFCLIRSDVAAKWTYRLRKLDWNLDESSIPKFEFWGRIWNAIMLVVFIYIFIRMPILLQQ